ncbi:MAG: class I SAM-dependent methyltransferase [Gammaproteobacteria bacterium]|nr:class I SAM-dependent methyltransferase [Gammaproteobacteria bacterium]
MPEDLTDFGFKKVPVAEKAKRVASVFDSVARRYDIMNDVMSLGSHRLMKRYAAEVTALRPGQLALDLAGGTGDLSVLLSPMVGETGRVVLCDINAAMVAEGRDRLIDKGIAGNVDFVLGDAEKLPFVDGTFDAITIGFGLRNVTDKDAALRAMFASLKVGGRLVILEFSNPSSPLAKGALDLFKQSWPLIGQAVADDGDSYRYLVESIEMHPDQKALKAMMEEAGFGACRYHNLAGGTAAIHFGIRE